MVDAKLWKKALKRGGNFDVKVKKTKVCSNHFSAGYYHAACNVPTLFMTGYDEKEKNARKPPKQRSSPKTHRSRNISNPTSPDPDSSMEYDYVSEVADVTITEQVPDHEYALTKIKNQPLEFGTSSCSGEGDDEITHLRKKVKRLEQINSTHTHREH